MAKVQRWLDQLSATTDPAVRLHLTLDAEEALVRYRESLEGARHA